MNKCDSVFSELTTIYDTTDPVRAASLPVKLSFAVFGLQDCDGVGGSVRPGECGNDFIFRGMYGHGVQSWRWRLVWQTPGCGVAFDVPCKGIYQEHEADGDDPRIVAEALADACLNITKRGLIFLNQNVRLYAVMDENDVSFRLLRENTCTVLYEGKGLAALLDVLDGVTECSHKRDII